MPPISDVLPHVHPAARWRAPRSA